MANKLDKALYGPSMTEVVLGAILGLIAGVAVACVYLTFKPVVPIKAWPKDRAVDVVYYLPGAESKAKSASWILKQRQFMAGANVQFNEEELNAWAETAAVAPKAPGSGAGAVKPAETPDTSGALVTPARPNFKIADGKLQISTVCTLNWSGLMTDVIVQTTGDFRKQDDHFVFTPETVYLGSCPLHLLPAAGGAFVNYVTGKQKAPDEVRAAWSKLKDVQVEGNTLRLVAQ